MRNYIFLSSVFCLVLLLATSCKKDSQPAEQEPEYPVIDPQFNTQVKGYVRDMNGRPIENVLVQLYEITTFPTYRGIQVHSVSTNKFGHYQMGYRTNTSSNVRYEISARHLKYTAFEDRSTVYKDSIMTQNFTCCLNTFVSFRYQDKSNIRCDSFDFEWFRPYGCFKAFTNQDYYYSFPVHERANGPHVFAGSDVPSGGYMKYYLTRFYQGAQTGGTIVDSLPMVAGDSINLWVDY